MSDDRERRLATPSQTVGPFFHVGPGRHLELGRLAGPDIAGEPLRLEVRVFDADAAAVPDAMVEIWHAAADGRYGSPAMPGGPVHGFPSFGRMPTDAEGSAVFETIRPGQVTAGAPAHINICLFMRGMLRHVYTRLYFAGDPLLEQDETLALVPADRRDTLVATPIADTPGGWRFDIHLQGDRETVFFDL